MRGIVLLQIQVNVIGFIPFGFFLSFWLIKVLQWASGHAFLGAIFIGISVSLSIELLQIYLPTRDSSMTDLICNTIGTILGVMLFEGGRRKAGKRGGTNAGR